MALIKNLDNSDFLSGAGVKNSAMRDSEKSIKKGIRYSSIDIDCIEFDPENEMFNRHDKDNPEEIEALAALIKLSGGLRFPVTVREIGPNRYLMRSGEKRLKAVRDVLGEKKIYCEIRDQFVEDENEDSNEEERFVDSLIFIGDNAIQRNYDDNQNFQMFVWLKKAIDIYTKSSGKDENKDIKYINSLLKFSKNKISKFQSVANNSSNEDLEKILKGELTFNDLSDIVKLQREEHRRQELINKSLELYAQSKNNEEIKYYIDRPNKTVYLVDEKIVRKKIKYGIKFNDFTDNRPAQWLINNEFPLVESRNIAQTFLDKLALLNDFEECPVEEYISLLNKSHGIDKDDENNSLKNTNKTTETKKLTFPEIKKVDNSFDSELEEENEENIKHNSESKIPKETKPSKKEKNKKQYETTSNAETLEDKEFKDTQNDIQLDLIKNRYALSIIFEGISLSTGEEVQGALIKAENDTRCFIVPKECKLVIKEDENKSKFSTIATRAIEVNPESVKEKSQRGE